MEKPSVKKLLISILLDVVGMATYIFPFIGEGFDLIWAPVAGLLLNRMYKGTVGKVGGIVVFLEELLPATDIIPTFTLTWLYTYFVAKRKQE
ncbi:MAG: hypothetical protein WCY89_01750 [Flavobacteriaceae bacterium]